MFCPVCKAEYREGFRECSDCGVALVRQLSDDSGGTAKFVGDPDAMEVLWAGVDAKASTLIGSALDAAEIAYEEDFVESQLMPAIRDEIYRIQVRRGDLEAAVKLMQVLHDNDQFNPWYPSATLARNSSLLKLYGFNSDLVDRINRGPIGEPSLSETATEAPEAAPIAEDDSEKVESTDDTADNNQLEDFFPEDATAEVWSGEYAEMGENIRMCLREVGINCDVRQENGNLRVFVLPEAEARAREIIREITEATAPE